MSSWIERFRALAEGAAAKHSARQVRAERRAMMWRRRVVTYTAAAGVLTSFDPRRTAALHLRDEAQMRLAAWEALAAGDLNMARGCSRGALRQAMRAKAVADAIRGGA